jgi:hypothetical protein
MTLLWGKPDGFAFVFWVKILQKEQQLNDLLL